MRIEMPLWVWSNKVGGHQTNHPTGAAQTNQARIRCKECNKDFHVNKGTCVLCSTYPSYCICTKKKPPGIGWQRNLTPLQDWIQPPEEKQTKGDPRPSNDAEEQGGITQPEPATQQGSGNIYLLPQEIHDVIAAAEDKRQTWTILGHKYLEFQIEGEGEPQEIFKLYKNDQYPLRHYDGKTSGRPRQIRRCPHPMDRLQGQVTHSCQNTRQLKKN